MGPPASRQCYDGGNGRAEPDDDDDEDTGRVQPPDTTTQADRTAPRPGTSHPWGPGSCLTPQGVGGPRWTRGSGRKTGAGPRKDLR